MSALVNVESIGVSDPDPDGSSEEELHVLELERHVSRMAASIQSLREQLAAEKGHRFEAELRADRAEERASIAEGQLERQLRDIKALIERTEAA